MEMAFSLPHIHRLPAITQPWEASVTGADQTRMVRRAEELGYCMVNVPEHFVIPNEHIELSGPHYFDATTAQAYIAGATEQIRINSFVTILPLHHPIVLAKALSTLDWLSSGRITLTLGVGWLAKEFEIMRVPFAERGRMADEYCEAMIELWTADTPSYDGKYVSFRDVAFEPKPVQRPHPPIWIGGDADAALRRAARFGTGWSPFLTQPEDFPARIDFIKSQPEFTGGDLDVIYALGTTRIGEGHVDQHDPHSWPGMTATELVDKLGWLHGLGVTITGLLIPPVAGPQAYMEYCQWVMEEVWPHLP